jgi:site-specific DNA-methyltransferase (adenine-specific)
VVDVINNKAMANSVVYNLDCMEGMKQYPDKYFDLAIVDPQYGIGESKRTQSRPTTAKQKNGTRLRVKGARKHKVKDWDLKRPPIEYFIELQRVSRNQIIWGGNHFADLLPACSGWIVWDKLNSESDQSDCELAWTSFKRGVRKFEFLWNGFLQGRTDNGRVAQGNKQLNEPRIHPTQKPVPLYKWTLNGWANEGDKILDTHLGSGSSRIAADEYGFDFIGFEIDTEYFEDEEKRFSRHKQQLKMFA